MRSGAVDNGAQALYAHDRADNRARITAGLPGTATFDVSDAAAGIEGAQLVFTVTRSGASSISQSVSYAAGGGSATVGADYTTTSGTLTFAAGETVKTIAVTTIDDTLTEPTESFVMTLSAATGGADIGAATANGPISDNDAPPPEIIALNPSYNLGTGRTLTIGLSALADTRGLPAIIISFSPTSGTAVIASDGGSVTYAVTTMRAPVCEAGEILNYLVPYSIRNANTGAITSGNAAFTVTQLDGPRPVPPAVCP